MAVLQLAVAILLTCAVESRLLFPPGSDMGYIVPDEPSEDQSVVEDDWLNTIENDPFSEALLAREEREALNEVEEALWKTVENSGRSARQENFQPVDQKLQPDPIENWHGKWFPHAPKSLNKVDNTGIPEDLPDSLKDDQHGVAMGIPNAVCDDAKVNLTMDWDGSPVNYTCFDVKRHRIPVLSGLESVEKCVDIPKSYSPRHMCMNTKIEYNTTLPTFGPHRPIWPSYGEYEFVPVQRWLHTIEHGGVVMLYDPCAEPVLVHRLRKLLKGCFRKHVITPYTLLTKERPLALVAWGCSLEMATVDDEEVRDFIKARALHGPEGHYPKDGLYTERQLNKAKHPPGSEDIDRNICP